MYYPVIKQGAFRIDESNTKTGLNLDQYLAQILIKYKSSMYAAKVECCNDHSLFLQSGTFTKKIKKGPNVFDLEKYIMEILMELGVMNSEDLAIYCCSRKPRIWIFTDNLYFSKYRVNKKNSLVYFIEHKLTSWGIGYSDPCCPDLGK